MTEPASVTVSNRGAARWVRGHPWIYRSDVIGTPEAAGIVAVSDPAGRFLGQALCSPRSEITLRLLTTSRDPVDTAWWTARIRAAAERRAGISASAFRVVHAEGDGLPSLVVDRYGESLVVQLLSAGLETRRDQVIAALVEALHPAGILLRNDVAVRRLEGLPEVVELVHGAVPEQVEVEENGIRYLADPWRGQKTGAFLDQRENRAIAAELMAPGQDALDCFAYHGSFALHLAKRARRVVAQDASAAALARAAENARLNGLTNIEPLEGDAFQVLRDCEHRRRRFQLIVLDPPAFAKSRASLPQAIRGYREINLRALRLLEPGGYLVTASCSFHLRRPEFLKMLAEAAADSGRRATLVRLLGQSADHPEVLTIPETGYLKGAVLQARD